MANTAIQVEHLSKRYVLHHAGQRRHTTLRAVAMDRVSAIAKRLTRSGASGDGPTTEEFWALRDVSLDIKQADRIGIIGRNGAGKSTLLKILSRVTEPSAGRVSKRGRMASLLEVGTGFHQDLSGRDNIYLNGAILGMSRREISRSFDATVEFSGVERFLVMPVKRYSSGMYVRHAFAVAAHLEPEILVVDEVLAVGDAEFKKKCLGRMSEVAQGRSVLFVSHNMVAIKCLCSSSVVLTDGRVASPGNVGTAIEQYLSDDSIASGEVKYPRGAGASDQVALDAVRVVAGGAITGKPRLDQEVEIQVDYRNFEPRGRRLVSIHVTTAMGVVVFTSSNLDMSSPVPDPWLRRSTRSACSGPRASFPRRCSTTASTRSMSTSTAPGLMTASSSSEAPSRSMFRRLPATVPSSSESGSGRSDPGFSGARHNWSRVPPGPNKGAPQVALPHSRRYLFERFARRPSREATPRRPAPRKRSVTDSAALLPGSRRLGDTP